MKRSRVPEEGWEDARDEARSRPAGRAAAGGGMAELGALIRAKQAGRAEAFDAMTAALEAKYGGGGGGKKAAGGRAGKGKASAK
jgi:hypothetical protein